MTLMHAVILGMVQGLTEFLPISSDGHLVIVSLFLGSSLEGRDALGFDILLHGGSLLALLALDGAVWWRLLSAAPRKNGSEARRMLGLLIVATIPAVIAGLFLEDVIAMHLRSLTAAAIGFLLTAGFLVAGEYAGARIAARPLGAIHALWMGLLQAFAILPGVSRSGSTTAVGRAFGLSRRQALDFSFLMAAPIIGGAIAKTLLDAFQGTVAFPPLPISFAGFLTSAVTSVAAILILRKLVASYSLSWFALYLVPLAAYLLLEQQGMLDMLSAEHVTEWVQKYGVFAVFGMAFIETVPPMSFFSPCVFALVVAGSLSPNLATVVQFLFAASAGVAIGNLILFRLGEVYGRKIAYKLRLTDEHMEAAEEYMARFGRVSIVIGQFFGLLRPALAFVAATTRMPRTQYVTWMLASSFIWAGVYLWAGYLMRDRVWLLISVLGVVGTALMIAGAVGIGIGRVVTRSTRKKK
jgi:undecaprenyl-diphosphatase